MKFNGPTKRTGYTRGERLRAVAGLLLFAAFAVGMLLWGAVRT